MILFLCFILPCLTLLPDGHTFEFWAGGHHVYFICIIFANIIVLKLQNTYSGLNETIMILHIACYVGSLYVWSEYMKFSVIYGFWDEWVTCWTAWFGIIMCVLSLWTLDEIFASIKFALRACIDRCLATKTTYR